MGRALNYDIGKSEPVRFFTGNSNFKFWLRVRDTNWHLSLLVTSKSELLLAFLPAWYVLVFQAEKLVARMFVPESNTLRRSLLSLARTSEKKREQGLRSRSSTTTGNIDEAVESADEQPITSTTEETISGGWRRHTDESLG